MLNIKRVSVDNTSSPRKGNYTRRHFLINKKHLRFRQSKCWGISV